MSWPLALLLISSCSAPNLPQSAVNNSATPIAPTANTKPDDGSKETNNKKCIEISESVKSELAKQMNALSLLKTGLDAMNFSYTACHPTGDPNLLVTDVHYGIAEKNYRGGLIFWLNTEHSPKVVWWGDQHLVLQGLDSKDCSFLDLNADGKEDLLLHDSDGEGYSKSYFILNNLHKTEFDPTNFVQAYESSGRAYAGLMDLDRDGSADLFDPDFSLSKTHKVFELEGYDYDYGDACSYFLDSQSPKEFEDLRKESLALSENLSKPYFGFNTYNPSDPVWSYVALFLYDKARILEFSSRSLRLEDKTSGFKEHILWRIRYLEKALRLFRNSAARLKSVSCANEEDEGDRRYCLSQRQKNLHNIRMCRQKIGRLLPYWKAYLEKP